MGEFTFENRVYKPHENLSWRDVNGELVAINVETGEYHVFDEIGRLVWLAIAEGRTAEDLVGQVLEEYDADKKETVVNDIKLFVDKLLQNRMLVASEHVA